jgi:hypothetical protein
MRMPRRIIQCILLTVVALAVAAPVKPEGSATRTDKDKKAKVRKARAAKSQSDPLVKRASRLAQPAIVDEGVNMLSLSRQVFDLEEGQKDQLENLARERNTEARELIKQLNQKYNEKAEDVLKTDQKKEYEAISSALRDFRSKIEPALENLEEAGGKPLVEWGRRGGRGKQLSIGDLLDLTEEQQRKIKQYEKESRAAQKEAQQTVAPPQDRGDKEAVRQYRQELKRAFQKIQQDYKTKVETLFSPEQKQKLQEIQQAMQQYAQKVKEARREYTQQLKESLSGN